MFTFQWRRAAAVLTLVACGATGAWAQTQGNLADGEVRKVDKEAGKITIRHGEIKSIDMPPMTMVFTVRDKAVLERFQSGDKVRFDAVREGGKLVITEIMAP